MSLDKSEVRNLDLLTWLGMTQTIASLIDQHRISRGADCFVFERNRDHAARPVTAEGAARERDIQEFGPLVKSATSLQSLDGD